jgi:hypothetical protein
LWWRVVGHIVQRNTNFPMPIVVHTKVSFLKNEVGKTARDGCGRDNQAVIVAQN